VTRQGWGIRLKRYVLLDTCVLLNCTLVNAVDRDPELLVTVFDKMREADVCLLLPQVVEAEFERKIPEELQLIRSQTKKFRAAISTEVLPSPDVEELHSTLDRLDRDREASVARAKAYFDAAAEDASLTAKIPLTGEIVATAVGYALAGKKPSRSGTPGVIDSDSLIVASLVSYAEANGLSGDDQILLCSDNHKDFGRWDEDAKRHVLEPDISGLFTCDVRYYKSPRELLEGELAVVVEADPPLAAALDDYDKLSHTMASVSASAFTEGLANIRQYISEINKDALTSLRESAFQLDPRILQEFRGIDTSAFRLDPELMKQFQPIDTSAFRIDDELVRQFRETDISAHRVDPEVLRAMREEMRLVNPREQSAEQEDPGEDDDKDPRPA